MKPQTSIREQLVKAAPPSLVLLVFMVVLVLALAACAPRQAATGEADGSDEGEQALNVPVWSLASKCINCHSMEADSADDSSTLYGFHVSTGSEEPCITCHNEEELLIKVHKTYYASTPSVEGLTKTQVSSEQCLSCHSLDEIARTTSEVILLTDINGKVVNPHQLPQGSDHESINCSDCHKMHTDKTLLPETAMGVCVSCHHEKVFECGTCH